MMVGIDKLIFTHQIFQRAHSKFYLLKEDSDLQNGNKRRSNNYRKLKKKVA